MQINSKDALSADLKHLRLLTDVEVSAVTGLAIQTLRKRRLRKVGPPWLKIGSAVRYRLSDVEAYLDANRIDPEANR